MLAPRQTSAEFEQELREQGYSLHPRSKRPISAKQHKLLMMLRAREAAQRGEGTKATYKGEEGTLVGSYFVYENGYVKFIVM